MTSTVPCLFCFSQANQSGGHQYQGDFPRVKRCYRLICDLLGIKLDPNEEFTTLFHKSYLPLCVSCALIFRNIAELQDHVLRLQQSINELAVGIHNKIKMSEQDGSLALAFAIQSIESNTARQGGGGGNDAQTALMLSWIQNFRQRAINLSGEIQSSQAHASGTQPNLVLVTDQPNNTRVGRSPVKYQVFGDFNQGVHEDESPITVFIGPDVVTSVAVVDNHNEHSDNGDEDKDDPDFKLDDANDDMSRGGSDDSDYEPIEKKPQSRLSQQVKVEKGITGKLIQTESPDKTTFRLNRKPVCKTRKRKPMKKVSKLSPKKKSYSTRGRKRTVSKSSSPKKSQLGIPKPRQTAIDSSKRFKCHLCPQSFTRPYYLANHITSHTGLNSYACRLCPDEKFATLKQIQVHNQLLHGTTHPFGCVKCDFNASTDEQLKQHMTIRHEFEISGPPYMCEICNDKVEFGSSHHLRRHLRAHTNGRSFHCCFCPLKTMRKDDLMKHMAKQHRAETQPSGGSSTFKCNMCPNEYPTSIGLITHYWGHGEKNSRFLNCKPCRLHFTTTFEYDLHNEEIHGDIFTRHPCSECDWVLHSEIQLQRHLLLHDPNRPKNHVCELCSKSFFTMSSYEQHMSAYHPDPTNNKTEAYRCSICSKSHIRKVDMVRCMKRHNRISDPAKVTCNLCDKVYKMPCDLKLHYASAHSENKPKCCEECPARFKLQHQLTRHKRMFHSEEAKAANKVYVYRERQCFKDEGEGSLMCELCGTVCSSRQVLKRHQMTIHTEERPFQCSGCNKTFKRQDDMKKHKDRYCGDSTYRPRTVEEDVQHVMNKLLKRVEKTVQQDEMNKFSCKACDESFPAMSQLRRHVFSVHSEHKLFRCTKCDLRFHSTVELTEHVRMDQCFGTMFEAISKVDVVEMALKLTDESLNNETTADEQPAAHRMKRKSAMRKSQVDSETQEFFGGIFPEDNTIEVSDSVDPADPDFSVAASEEDVSDGEGSESSHSEDRSPKKKKSILSKIASLKCPDCDLRFQNHRHMQRHQISIHSNIRPFGCASCSSTFKRTDDLLKHHRKSKCGQPFKRLFTDSKTNKTESHNTKTNIKEENTLEDTNSNDVSDIKEAVSTDRTDVECKSCGKTFFNRHSLQRHVRTIHNDERPFKCKHCRNTFKRRDDLLKHMRNFCETLRRKETKDSDDSDADYVSDDDSEVESSLKEKQSIKVSGPSDTVECELCKKEIAINSLSRHKETKHKGERPFRCIRCPKSFYLLEDYMTHSASGMCMSSKESKLPVNRVQRNAKSLMNKSNPPVELPNITYTPTEEMIRSKFAYILRNKEIAVKLSPLEDPKHATLNSHVASTSRQLNSFDKLKPPRSSTTIGPKSKRRKVTERPESLICGACEKSFTSWPGLKRHMQTIHNSARPYECEVCEKTFKRKDDMMKHTKKQHPQVTLQKMKPGPAGRKKVVEAIIIKPEPESDKEEDVESSIGSEFEFGPRNLTENDDDNEDANWNAAVYIDDSSVASSELQFQVSRDDDFSD